MSPLIVYSSQTGNTRLLARALAKSFSFPLCTALDHPDLIDFSVLILGFWLRRGLPDPDMLSFLKKVKNKDVFFFCTHAAWPDSEHVLQCREKVTAMLCAQGNRILGFFSCQGRMRAETHHPMTEERMARLAEAAKHPNEKDCHELILSLSLALAGGRG